MKNKKISLEKLTISSFVTDLNDLDAKTIQGGLIYAHLGAGSSGLDLCYNQPIRMPFSAANTCQLVCCDAPLYGTGPKLDGPALPK